MDSEASYIQLIEGDGKFTNELPKYLEKFGLNNIGTRYSLLSVFGPQSSGKSTLLNHLFGTRFTTMNSTSGRYQVTRGVCLSNSEASNKEPILVMDMEGTDSKERGEKDMSFEKKISLFALSISEILIINMWMTDIGRYNASNLSLLKIVFELNLRLFQRHNSHKTLLLFCIRDHIEANSSLDVLRNQVMKDVENCWESLIKDSSQTESKLSDFFDIEFTSLPHMILMEDAFKEAVEKLRLRFIDPSNEGYLFKPHYKKSVPINDFEMYASENWKIIWENKDLDIPTQKEILASHRCTQISSELFVEFETSCKPWKEEVSQKHIIPKLGKLAQLEAQKVLAKYDQQTEHYLQKIVEIKRNELLSRMKEAIFNIFRSQLLIIREKYALEFKQRLDKLVNEANIEFQHFIERSQDFEKDALDKFEEETKESKYPDEDWDYSIYRQQLEDEIGRYIKNERLQLVRKLVDVEKSKLIDSYKDRLSALIVNVTKDIWKEIRKIDREKRDETSLHLEKLLKSLGASELVESTLATLGTNFKSTLKSVIKNYINQISFHMNNEYDKSFNSTGQIVRKWKSKEDIIKTHKEAVQEALKLLDIFFVMRLDGPEYDNIHLEYQSLSDSVEFKFPDMDEVISILMKYKMKTKSVSEGSKATISSEIENTLKLSIESDFKENLLLDNEACNRVYQEFRWKAQSSLQITIDRFALLQASQRKIPWWIFLIMLVLGWNELMYFVKSFYFLAFLLIIALSSYIKTYIDSYLENGKNELIKYILLIVVEKCGEIYSSIVESFPLLDRMTVQSTPSVNASTAANTNNNNDATQSQNPSSSDKLLRFSRQSDNKLLGGTSKESDPNLMRERHTQSTFVDN